jgi:acetyl esterase/lipase
MLADVKLPLFLPLVLLTLPLLGEDATLPPGYHALFDGTDLKGWHGLNPHTVEKLEGEKREASVKQQLEDFPKSWRVEDGELVNDGTGPYATTDEDYGDMELHLEYKTVPMADSGVYLRGCPQVQIWDITQADRPNQPDRHPKLGSGGLYNNTPHTFGRDPLEPIDKPFGQWNTLRIRQIGALTWVWLNEKPVVAGAVMENYWDRTKPLPAKGPIMLQTHGGEIRWRNISIHEFSAEEAKRALSSMAPTPSPTVWDVSYGPHPKQVLAFWKAESDHPAPLLFFIHGGGWTHGDRLSGLGGLLPAMLKAGISVVSVEYRFINEATADGVNPPVQGPLGDAARALQFVRSKATEWNIDKARIAASGGSAGACSSLWLDFHDDLADPKSTDPIARESTRLWCAAVDAAQTTLDPQQMVDWTPNSSYGGHAFGLGAFANFLANREKILPWIAEYSPYALVTSDDPPIFMHYGVPPGLGQDQKDPTHTSNFGVKLQEHCQAAGVECTLVYPGAPAAKWASIQEYLLDRLKAPTATSK